MTRSRTYGVEFDIPCSRQQIRLIEDERGEPPLPEVSAPAFAEVDHPACIADEPPRSRVAGHRPTVGPRSGARDWASGSRPRSRRAGPAEPGHQLQVALVILVTEESLLPAVAPLGDVMRQTRCNDAQPIEPSQQATASSCPGQELSMVSPEVGGLISGRSAPVSSCQATNRSHLTPWMRRRSDSPALSRGQAARAARIRAGYRECRDDAQAVRLIMKRVVSGGPSRRPSPHPRPSRPSGYNPVELSRFAGGPPFGISIARPARSSWVFDDPQPLELTSAPVSPSRPSSSESLSTPRFRPLSPVFPRSAQGIPAPPLTTVVLRTPW